MNGLLGRAPLVAGSLGARGQVEAALAAGLDGLRLACEGQRSTKRYPN